MSRLSIQSFRAAGARGSGGGPVIPGTGKEDIAAAARPSRPWAREDALLRSARGEYPNASARGTLAPLVARALQRRDDRERPSEDSDGPALLVDVDVQCGGGRARAGHRGDVAAQRDESVAV